MSEPTTVFLVGRRDASKRLDHFLKEKIPGLSRSRIQQAIRERVTLSWKVEARASTPVRPGGEVQIGYTPLQETPLELEIPVLQQGRGWLAVDKPSGIPVHPVNKVRENTLIRMLRRQVGDEELRLVHRLDRETTGVLLVADNSATARSLSQALMNRQVDKEYLALVRGAVPDESGTIDSPIGDDERSRVYVRRAVGSGQPAMTHWRVVRRFEDRTLLRVVLETGRRHQIRVHLEALGHPVLGDLLYGRPDADYLTLVGEGRDVRVAEGGPLRQLLHCARMTFDDPTTGERTAVSAPLPEDFGVDDC